MKKLPRILLPILLVAVVLVTILAIFIPFGESTAPDALAVDANVGTLAVACFDEQKGSSVIHIFDPTGKRITTVVPKYQEATIPVVHFDENGNLRFYLPTEGHYYTVTVYGDVLAYHTADKVDPTPHAYTSLWSFVDGTYTTTAADRTYTYTSTTIIDRMAGHKDTVAIRDASGHETTVWTSAD